MTQEEKEELGQRIRSYRGYRRMTQDDLAEQVGTTREWVSLIENGYKQPNIGMLKGFCRALGVEPNVLLGWVEPHEAGLTAVEG